MQRRLPSRALRLLALDGTAVAIAAGASYAATPAADGSITACYRTKGGDDDRRTAQPEQWPTAP